MVEGIAAAIAHNVRPEVFLKHYRSIRDCSSAHKATGSDLSLAKKSAKSDGVDLDALRMLEKLAKLDGDEADLILRHLSAYAQWAEMPWGSQAELFGMPKVPPEEAQKQREYEAAEEGKRAGKAGEPRENNRYSEPGSPEFVAWDKAWKKASAAFNREQKAIADQMGRNAGNGATTGRRRGRPRRDNAATNTLV
jgi:hypothetical protein